MRFVRVLQFGLAEKRPITGRKLRKERKNRAKKYRGALALSIPALLPTLASSAHKPRALARTGTQAAKKSEAGKKK